MTTKKLFFTILFSLTVAYASAQQGITLKDAHKEGIGSDVLDKTYDSALSTVETTLTGERKDEVLSTAWQKLLKDLGAFLKKNDFEWKEDARCMNKVYFTPEGKITYFLYDVPSLDEKEQAEFKRLLNIFIKDYTFGYTAKKQFTQCGPTKFKSSIVKK